MELQHDRNSRLQHNIGLVGWGCRHVVRDGINSLQDPGNSICHFCQCKLLADANSRASVEWNIPEVTVSRKWRLEGKRYVRPGSRRPRLPSLGNKLIDGREARGYRRINVFASLHGQGGIRNRRILENPNRLQTVCPTSVWKRGILERHPDIERYNGIKTKRLIHRMLSLVRQHSLTLT
jgi:hypothetical protein